jgi:hypothetical protein
MDNPRRQRWNTDDAYPKSYRERRESHHHHEKPEHPNWNGTYNLDTLFEEPEDWQKATALHPYEEYEDPHHYGYSSSPDTDLFWHPLCRKGEMETSSEFTL